MRRALSAPAVCALIPPVPDATSLARPSAANASIALTPLAQRVTSQVLRLNRPPAEQFDGVGERTVGNSRSGRQLLPMGERQLMVTGAGFCTTRLTCRPSLPISPVMTSYSAGTDHGDIHCQKAEPPMMWAPVPYRLGRAMGTSGAQRASSRRHQTMHASRQRIASELKPWSSRRLACRYSGRMGGSPRQQQCRELRSRLLKVRMHEVLARRPVARSIGRLSFTGSPVAGIPGPSMLRPRSRTVLRSSDRA